MHEKREVACRSSRHGQYPQLHAIVELPTVDILKGILSLDKMSFENLNLPGCCECSLDEYTAVANIKSLAGSQPVGSS